MSQQPCHCEAYPFPHRKGGGRCHEDLVCEHGHLLPGHPNYDPDVYACRECAYWESIDRVFDACYDR